MVTSQPQAKSRRDRDKERKDKTQVQVSAPGDRLKTIVRRLPPNLPEDIFWQSVQAWVTEDTVTWKVYYLGKASKRLNKENVPSRAYIAFKDEETLMTFSREYDGHIFRDKSGNEFQAVVEFAPYQKVPSDRKKVDARLGTIEKDEDYISFIEALEASKKAEPVSLEALIASTQPAPMPTTTPLLEALKAEKSAAKDREAILRNHAHYKEIASRKEDAKKKAAASQAARQDPPHLASETSSGKRGKKGGAPPLKQGPPLTNAQPVKPPQIQTKPPPNTSPAKPPKAFRSRGKQQAPVESNSSTSTPASQSTNNEVSKVPTAGPSQPQAATTSAQPPTAPRRMRLGLASRQFEAALSGVGVSRRRDREDKADSPAGEGPRDGVSDGAQTPIQAAIPLSPRSPKRERRRKEDGASAGGGGPNGAGVPGILQRIDAPQAQGNINARIDAAPPPPNFGPPARGGAPRGRGRGRGRGGSVRGSG
ncbi:hypothetical protein PC9H_000308 [Pleurotus ostreatus]|uniref:UPF3 domain-containing protein n=1 Tax=Pleurotus ostreatus TaxID=5322 RepID=A0A8H7DZ87_PLEOS|nr:uncharacterized protein PC9H_000308 [Pleurotus ostreatus]KAF7439971.1 hypothetical protein PC9H_000308 [Pleurotus ostreatus]